LGVFSWKAKEPLPTDINQNSISQRSDSMALMPLTKKWLDEVCFEQ
jgi:hypothetical protein